MLLQVKKLWFFFFLCSILKLPVNCNTPESAKVSCTLLYFFLYFCCMMLGSKSILLPTDTHELLRCYATFAILKTFGFADFPWKSLHPHVFAGPKLKNLIVQARTAFWAFDPGIIIIKSVVFSLKSVLSFVNFYGILNIKDFYPD